MADPVRVHVTVTSYPPLQGVVVPPAVEAVVHPDDLARAIRREMAAEIEIIRDDLRKGIDVDDALRWSHDRLTAPAPREPAQERQDGGAATANSEAQALRKALAWLLLCLDDCEQSESDEGNVLLRFHADDWKRAEDAWEKADDALVASSTPVPPGGADPLLPGLRAALQMMIGEGFYAFQFAIRSAERAARAQERERCAGIIHRWSPASANTDAWLRERDLVIGEIRSAAEAPKPEETT